MHYLYAMQESLHFKETGTKLADHFSKHLCDVAKKKKKMTKMLPNQLFPSSTSRNHSTHNMKICSLSLHQRNTESFQNCKQKSFNSAFLILMKSRNTSHLTNLFFCSNHHFSTNDTAPSSPI